MRYVTLLTAAAAFVLFAQSQAGAADNARGKELYIKYGCVACHGTEGQGGPGGRIAPNPLPLPAFSRYIRAPRGVMPPYTEKALSSNQEVAEIHAYLSSRARPASPDVLKALGIGE